MVKVPSVEKKTWKFAPGAPSCDVHQPTDKGLKAARQQDGPFFIVPGLGSIKADYGLFARALAKEGFVVVSPNCNEAMESSRYEKALDRRAEVLVGAMAAFDAGQVRLIPHSLGGPVTAKAREQISQDPAGKPKIISISSMQPAGFQKHGPLDIFRGIRFFTDEAIPRTARLTPSLLQNPRGTYERLNIAQRAREVRELWSLPPGYMQEATQDAYDAGIHLNYFLGPKDSLTPPGSIRRTVTPIVGGHNVFDIHPEAGHLAAQTHPRHIAHAILGQLMSVEDAQTPLLIAA